MIKLPEIKTENDLFIFLLHIIQERFMENAILKGGMVLRLLGSTRKTLDLDYVFVPFKFKNEILQHVKVLFSEIEGITYRVTINSKAIRVNIEVGKLRSQIEINVAKELKTDVISTANLKEVTNSTSPRIIKIMSLDIALSDKLAAWNERRLLRDLYDIYYFLEVQNIIPDKKTLLNRLSNIQSKKPGLKKIKKVTLNEFIESLMKEVEALDQGKLEDELQGILDKTELIGLAYKIKDTLKRSIVKIDLLKWNAN